MSYQAMKGGDEVKKLDEVGELIAHPKKDVEHVNQLKVKFEKSQEDPKEEKLTVDNIIYLSKTKENLVSALARLPSDGTINRQQREALEKSLKQMKEDIDEIFEKLDKQRTAELFLPGPRCPLKPSVHATPADLMEWADMLTKIVAQDIVAQAKRKDLKGLGLDLMMYEKLALRSDLFFSLNRILGTANEATMKKYAAKLEHELNAAHSNPSHWEPYKVDVEDGKIAIRMAASKTTVGTIALSLLFTDRTGVDVHRVKNVVYE